MKILLMSDTHLGFGAGTEREEDAFLTFEEGIKKGLEADFILLGGDVFDTRVPTPETFARTMATLLQAREHPSETRIVEGIGKEIKNHPQGLPVVAISGNHERRVKGLLNPVEALERGGFLFHLHCNGLVLQKGVEKVAVQGLSAVPTSYAAPILQQWNPQPIPGAFNIFLFHQNLEGFVRSPETLPKESLPRGFDLYICGDIHESQKSQVEGKPLILPGSTVATQITKDACNPRVYSLIDTGTGQIDFLPLENQRKIYYEEFQDPQEAEPFLKETLSQPHPLKPIIKIKSPYSPPEDLQVRFGSQAILMTPQEAEQLPSLTLEEQRLSAQLSGKEILAKNLQQLNLDPHLFESVFELLLNKKQDEALALLKQRA